MSAWMYQRFSPVFPPLVCVCPLDGILEAKSVSLAANAPMFLPVWQPRMRSTGHYRTCRVFPGFCVTLEIVWLQLFELSMRIRRILFVWKGVNWHSEGEVVAYACVHAFERLENSTVQSPLFLA